LNSVQSRHSAQVEQQLESFTKERNGLLAKIEKLAGELAEKDKDLNSTVYKLEQASSNSMSKGKELDELKVEYTKDRETME
jgi:uncharacterized protein YoxC